MNTNQIFHWMLTAVLVCGLGMCAASCSKDSYDKKVDSRIEREGDKVYVPEELLTDQERYQLACQSAVIGTMRSLTGLDDVTPDVTNITHESTYGKTLDSESPMVRVAKCESTEEAEELFRSICDIDGTSRLLTATVDGYVLNLTDLPILPDGKTFTLGSLTFHRDGGPRRYGYVEVNIPCIPHVERIDFLGPDAFPDNAGVNSAYQIGDIVKVNSGYCTGYYVCVQPYAYTDGWLVHLCINAGNGETVNADGDSQGCFYPVNKDRGQETTYDMINAYCNFICDNQEKVANIKAYLNGEAYDRKPSLPGCLHHIFPEGFNNDKGMPFYSSDGRGAAIWYDAYVTDKYAWVPAYYYRKGHCGLVAHNVKYWRKDDYTYVKDTQWNSKWGDNWNYCMNAIRFTTRPIDNSTLEYSPLNDKLQFGIYAANASKSHIGWCYADDGYLYGTRKKAEDYGHTPLGIVVYVNDGSDWGKKVTEPDHGGGHGLVMSYREYPYRYSTWCNLEEPYTADEGYFDYLGFTHGDARKDFSGYDKTQVLEYEGLYAATYAINMYPVPNPDTTPSGWFLPTAAQWEAALCSPGIGNTSWPSANDAWTKSFPGSPVVTINKYVHDRDSYATLAGMYWTSSAQYLDKGVFIRCYGGGEACFTDADYYIKNDDFFYVRPFLAF